MILYVSFPLWSSRVLSCLYGKFIISHNPSYSFQSFTTLQLVFLSNRLTSKMNQNNKTSLEELYANLSLEEDDEGGVVVGIEEVQEKKTTYVLVGRFLTEKNINFQAMQNVMASLWRPKEGMEIHDIGGYKYSFVFYHIMDLRKVLEGGPWSFEQNMLVYKQVNETEDLQTMELNEVEIWVQVHDVLKGFIYESIMKSMGMYIGKYVKSDSANFDGTWKPYVRIRVVLDIQKPLRRRMKIKREGGAWSWLNFKYERLGTFCFVCGILGHTERECNVVYENPEKEIERAYGVWLRAQNRNSKSGIVARWLRSSDGGGKWSENSGDTGSQSKSSKEKEAERFVENDGLVREKNGDQGAVVVAPRNQEGFGEIQKDLNLADNRDIIIDTKGKRVEIIQEESTYGPKEMITDGLQTGNTEETVEGNIPKNLYGVGSGIQAHRVL